MKKILSIDGGGIKGVFPAAFLAALERNTEKRVVDHFDLIVGTSTGGIIALGLGLGVPAADILRLYTEEGPAIFGQLERPIIGRFERLLRGLRRLFRGKYSAVGLTSALEGVFKDRLLGESKTRLVVPSFDRKRGTVYIFKTAHDARLRTDYKERVVDVALATAAAPTYFPSHTLKHGESLIDGGIWANDPVGLAAVEAVGLLKWDPEELRILSVGCTEEIFSIPQNAGLGTLGSSVVDMFMQAQAKGSQGTAKLLTRHTDESPRVHRVQVMVEKGLYSLDGVKQARELAGYGSAEARERCTLMESVFFREPAHPFVPCHQLAGVGPEAAHALDPVAAAAPAAP